MDHHVGHLGIGGDAQQGVEVVLLAVDAPTAHQPHQVEPTALLLGGGQCLLEHGLGGDGPVGDGSVDAEQILIDNAASPDVEVAHFAVAHLPFRQADVFTVRGECGVGVVRQQAIEARRGGDMHGVVAVGAADSPAVEDDEGGLVGHRGAKVSPEVPLRSRISSSSQQKGGDSARPA